jgi:hypothetical protein
MKELSIISWNVKLNINDSEHSAIFNLVFYHYFLLCWVSLCRMLWCQVKTHIGPIDINGFNIEACKGLFARAISECIFVVLLTSLNLWKVKDFINLQNEMRWNFIKIVRSSSKILYKIPGILLNYWTKFALLLSIFHGMDKSWFNSVNILWNFQVIWGKFIIDL